MLPRLAGVDAQVMRRDMRVGQHDIVVERATDAQRPRRDRNRLADLAFAIQQIDDGRGSRLACRPSAGPPQAGRHPLGGSTAVLGRRGVVTYFVHA